MGWQSESLRLVKWYVFVMGTINVAYNGQRLFAEGVVRVTGDTNSHLN